MKRTALLAGCLMITCATRAEEPAPADSTACYYDLSEVVVTGTRTPKSLKNTPVQTRLISSSELQRADATNLQDLLQQELPGVEFAYAMNQQVNMNLAGFSGLGVLVLVDGERLAGETMDNVDFSRLPMNNVERIEIIRGAASALYGSNAAGGVINIITKGAGRKWSASIGGRAGSHGEWRADGSLGLKIGRVSNMLDVNFYRIGAYDVCLDTGDDCDFRKVYANHVWNFSDRLTWRPLDNLSFTGRAGYYFKEREYNPDMPNRYRAFSGGLKGDWEIDADDRLEITYAYDQYDKSDLNRELHLDIRDYCNVQHSWRALYNRSLREADMLTVGGDVMRDWLTTYQFTDDEVHSQYTADVFAQYDWNITEKLELVGAARWDWFSDGNTNCVTPKLNVRYLLGSVTLRAGYAGGFRAPSLKEKYMWFNMADIFDIHGNPDLKPEKSHNVNLSAEYTWHNFYFMAAANYNLVKNKIATSGILYDAEHNPYIDYINVEDLRVFGVDASVRARWNCGISASLAYNFTHEDTHGGSVTQYCPARPHSLNARVSWTKTWHSGWISDVSLNGRFLSAVSYDAMYMYEPFETRRITNPAYTLWKLQLSQTLFDGVKLMVAVDNLLNYRPKVYAFNAPVTTGTSLQIGINIELEKLWK